MSASLQWTSATPRTKLPPFDSGRRIHRSRRSGRLRRLPDRIQAARRIYNYEGWLVVEAEQDPAIANPLEYARMARAYVKGAHRTVKLTHYF